MEIASKQLLFGKLVLILSAPGINCVVGEFQPPGRGDSGLVVARFYPVSASSHSLMTNIDEWHFQYINDDSVAKGAIGSSELPCSPTHPTAAPASTDASTEIVAPRRAREVYDHAAFVADLDAALGELREMLINKNLAYGDSALNPVRVFSKASTMEQLFVRIDDKLSRLKRGDAAGEDVLADLRGYLVLVRIAEMRAERSPA